MADFIFKIGCATHPSACAPCAPCTSVAPWHAESHPPPRYCSLSHRNAHQGAHREACSALQQLSKQNRGLQRGPAPARASQPLPASLSALSAWVPAACVSFVCCSPLVAYVLCLEWCCVAQLLPLNSLGSQFLKVRGWR